MSTWQDLRDALYSNAALFESTPDLAAAISDLFAIANAEAYAEARMGALVLVSTNARRYQSAIVDDAVRRIATTVDGLSPNEPDETESPDEAAYENEGEPRVSYSRPRWASIDLIGLSRLRPTK